MKITIIGSGYVGLVSGICLAKIGHEVVCVDKLADKIFKLELGEIPIFEPNLKELLKEVVDAKRISFSTSLQEAIEACDVVFIAVGTPQGEDGSADLSYVFDAVKQIAQFSKNRKLIITKSTVPAGTGFEIKKLVKKINPNVEFLVASNPEFLREGSAIYDFMNPDRIVIGIEDEKSEEILREIYGYFGQEKIVVSDIITAELIKYAANSFLASKITFINEMANLCEKLGADVKKLAFAIGLDERIGGKFLNVGPGFGGSCFPKDILAILNIAKENGVDLSVIEAAKNSNDKRKVEMAQRAIDVLGGNVEGKKIALLGLAFKGNTDDIRYSPAIVIAKELLKKGAIVNAHDFEAIENSRLELEGFSNITFFEDYLQAILECDLIVIATEWKEYGKIDLEEVKKLTKSRKILDLRNLLDEKKVENAGFEYFYIGGKLV